MRKGVIMALLASESRPAEQRPVQKWLIIWATALAAVLLLFLFRDTLPFAVESPPALVIPIADWVTAVMVWLKINISWLTRFITTVLNVPLDFALDLFAKNFKIGRGLEAIALPRLSWVG